MKPSKRIDEILRERYESDVTYYSLAVIDYLDEQAEEGK